MATWLEIVLRASRSFLKVKTNNATTHPEAQDACTWVEMKGERCTYVEKQEAILCKSVGVVVASSDGNVDGACCGELKNIQKFSGEFNVGGKKRSIEALGRALGKRIRLVSVQLYLQTSDEPILKRDKADDESAGDRAISVDKGQGTMPTGQVMKDTLHTFKRKSRLGKLLVLVLVCCRLKYM